MTDAELLEVLLDQFEGARSDDPTDAGNAGGTATIWGWTWSTFHGFFPEVGYPAFLAMSKAEAIERYRVWLLVRRQLGEIHNSLIKITVVDWAINSGPTTAIRALQRIVHVTPDGIFGPDTREAVNRTSDPRSLRDRVLASRLRFLAKTPEIRSVKRGGWLNRVATLLEMDV